MFVALVLFLLNLAMVFMFTADGVSDSAKRISLGITVIAILWIVFFSIL